MRGMVTVDTAAVEARVQAVLPAFAEIAGAYLFGSCLDACRPDSDLDLALVPGDVADPIYLEARASGALGRVAGHPFHVTVLRPGEFAFQAICEGRLVYEADGDVVRNFLEEVAREHEANRRFLETFARARKERLRQWL